MSHRHHHHHHFEWWLTPVYAVAFMGIACWWIVKLYALAFIYAGKAIRWAVPRVAAFWRSWRAGSLMDDARKATRF
jgi:hypothetical protein